MKYLILFDIDGTILKFRQYHSKEIFAKMLKEVFGKDVPLSIMPDFSGMTDLQILKDIANKINLDSSKLIANLPKVWASISKDFEKYCTSEYMLLLPNIRELITYFDTHPDFLLGLLTGNFIENAYIKLRAFNLEGFFQFGAFGSDKDDRNLLPPIAINRANDFVGFNIFDKKNTLLIGDSPRDIECAKSNNLPVLAVATGNFSANELFLYKPDCVLNDFKDLELTICTIKNLLNTE
ncbi:HAD family hydrolase [Bacteroidetes/Chlorobi group bacterium ChocPot_Mid]|jgi:phosphoglycolate phosphatase-like HAD superfamily hydrolase|nr:MAG: HAD family hydrolase [Bacteroidetes/Chlorobi group bacterium ChocPot_Mid]